MFESTIENYSVYVYRIISHKPTDEAIYYTVS
jgi:hypothetical protein